MKYLISGSINPFFEDGSFANFLTSNEARKVIVIGDHHTKGGDYAYKRALEALSKANSRVTLFKGNYDFFMENEDLSIFDGMYISGGLMDALFYYLYSLNIYDSVKRFVQDPSKVYVGASAGTLLVAKKMFTESEMDAIHLSRFTDEGFGFFPDKLLEVHYDEDGNKEVLERRLRKALQENDDLTEAYALESDCCLQFTGFSAFDFSLLRGKFHLMTR